MVISIVIELMQARLPALVLAKPCTVNLNRKYGELRINGVAISLAESLDVDPHEVRIGTMRNS
jgi:hypothetical protein